MGQLLRWLRRRVLPGSEGATTDPPGERLVSTGRLQPTEDETSGEFADRVARIKADVLRRALAAIEVEPDGEGPVGDEADDAVTGTADDAVTGEGDAGGEDEGALDATLADAATEAVPGQPVSS